eukprot:g47952.t1
MQTPERGQIIFYSAHKQSGEITFGNERKERKIRFQATGSFRHMFVVQFSLDGNEATNVRVVLEGFSDKELLRYLRARLKENEENCLIELHQGLLFWRAVLDAAHSSPGLSDKPGHFNRVLQLLGRDMAGVQLREMVTVLMEQLVSSKFLQATNQLTEHLLNWRQGCRPLRDCASMLLNILRFASNGATQTKTRRTVELFANLLRQASARVAASEGEANIKQQLDAYLQTLESLLSANKAHLRVPQKPVPPGKQYLSFQQTPLFPTAAALTSSSELSPTWLPKNQECYSSAEEYLTVHFHLLRADCFLELKRSVKLALQPALRKPSDHGVWVYRDVKLRAISFAPQLCHLVSFALDKGQHFKNTSHLAFSNVVLLATPDFQTAAWATVVFSQPQLLKQGLVYVSFQSEKERDALELRLSQLHTGAVMLESQTFFLAFGPVLKAIKAMEPSRLPFQSELVAARPSQRKPDYVQKAVDLGLVRRQENVKLGDKVVRLNDKQIEAVEWALNNRVALIQGLPGTGKTTLGHIIVERILQLWTTMEGPQQERDGAATVASLKQQHQQLCQSINALYASRDRLAQKLEKKVHARINGRAPLCQEAEQERKKLVSERHELFESLHKARQERNTLSQRITARAEEEQTAMAERRSLTVLVITYKNHALDDFLKGCLRFTQQLVRIGGMSEEKELDAYNLNRLVSSLKRQSGSRQLDQAEDELDQLMEKLQAKLQQISEVKKKLAAPKSLARELMSHPRIVSERQWEGLLHGLRNDEKPRQMLARFLANYRNEEAATKKPSLDNHDNKHGKGYMAEVEKQVRKEHAAQKKPILSPVAPSPASQEQKQEDEEEEDDKWLEDALERAEMMPTAEVSPSKRNTDKGKAIREATVKLLALPSSPDGNHEAAYELFDREGQQLWQLPRPRKQQLIQLWLARYCRLLDQERLDLVREYERQLRVKEEIYDQLCLSVLAGAQVVGMTSTGCAMKQRLFKGLQPAIVLVEEAGEILEAGILPALTEATQHLILIGDHKQLRPKVENHQLCHTNRMDMSMFERLVGSLKSAVLEVQFRMRPEVSELRSKSSRRPWRTQAGVFLVACVPRGKKQRGPKSDELARSRYGGGVAELLLREGVEPKAITILATYKGQSKEIVKRLKQKMLEDVLTEVCTVEKYQGDENDFVILSLVRSNSEKPRIGFLKVENRMCVALSRARRGFILLGNGAQLRASSLIWDRTIQLCEARNAFALALPMHCVRHPEVTFEAKVPAELYKSFCAQQCTFQYDDCGHLCERKCHPHSKQDLCTQKCDRLLPCPDRHRCQAQCAEQCPPCRETVLIQLKECRHKLEVKCCDREKSFLCELPCQRISKHRKGNPCLRHSRCYLTCGEACDSKPCRECAEEAVKEKELMIKEYKQAIQESLARIEQEAKQNPFKLRDLEHNDVDFVRARNVVKASLLPPGAFIKVARVRGVVNPAWFAKFSARKLGLSDPMREELLTISTYAHCASMEDMAKELRSNCKVRGLTDPLCARGRLLNAKTEGDVPKRFHVLVVKAATGTLAKRTQPPLRATDFKAASAEALTSPPSNDKKSAKLKAVANQDVWLESAEQAQPLWLVDVERTLTNQPCYCSQEACVECVTAFKGHDSYLEPPAYWTAHAKEFLWDASDTPDQPFLDSLARSDPRFQLVESLMNQTISPHPKKAGKVNGLDPESFHVLRFERALTNLPAKDCSKHFSEHPIKTGPVLDASSNLYWLFHGTDRKTSDILTTAGYDSRVSSVTGMFGGGFYLAENSSKSNQYIPCPTCEGNAIFARQPCTCPQAVQNDQTYIMLIYRAALGNAHIMTHYDEKRYRGEMANKPVRRPPNLPASNRTYDSVFAECNPAFPHTGLVNREIIIYDQHQAYPEFLVEFRRSAKPARDLHHLAIDQAALRVAKACQQQAEPRNPPDLSASAHPDILLKPIRPSREVNDTMEEKHFRTAESQCLRMFPKLKVAMVELVQNSRLEQDFFRTKANLIAKAGSANTVYGFHGTSEDNIQKICRQNFDLSKLGAASGDRGYFGAGTYFSEHPDYCLRYCRTHPRKLLLCWVALGKVYNCNMQIGRELEPGFNSHQSPDKKELVIFDPTQILPRYVVTFGE